MQRISAFLLAMLSLTVTVAAQTPDPATILRKTDSACRLIRTATYRAEASKRSEEKLDWTRAGTVTLERLDKDAVGARVRIVLNDGIVYVYDGTSLHLVQPEQREVLDVGPEIPGSSFITGNVTHQLLPPEFLEDSVLIGRLAEASGIEYRGVQKVDNVDCHVITMHFPNDELASDLTRELYIGVHDYLPRRSVTTYVFAEKKNRQERVVHDLKVNISVPDTTFTLAMPEGYTRKQYHREKQPEPLAAGVAAPDWTLNNPSGKPVSLQSLRGKLVMLDFWYTTCGPCIMAMPTIQKLHERFRDRGVAVYGVNPWQHDSADAIRLMAKRGYTYGLVTNGEEVAKAYNVSAYPTFYLIGDDGVILYTGVGYGEEREAELVDIIEKYLHERGR